MDDLSAPFGWQFAIDPFIAKGLAHVTVGPPAIGVLRAAPEDFRVEEVVLAPLEKWRRGLEMAGLKQQRRALRIRVKDLAWEFSKDGNFRLRFQLGPGAYATSVLREIVRSS